MKSIPSGSSQENNAGREAQPNMERITPIHRQYALKRKHEAGETPAHNTSYKNRIPVSRTPVGRLHKAEKMLFDTPNFSLGKLIIHANPQSES